MAEAEKDVSNAIHPRRSKEHDGKSNRTPFVTLDAVVTKAKIEPDTLIKQASQSTIRL